MPWLWKRRPVVTLALLAALGLGVSLLTACAGSVPESPSMEGTWKLATFGTDAVPDGVEITMEVRPDGTAGGIGGCNRYTGKLAGAEDGSVATGPLAATRRACPSPGMEAEVRYFETLQKATAWRLDDGHLELLGDGGQILLRYAPAS